MREADELGMSSWIIIYEQEGGIVSRLCIPHESHLPPIKLQSDSPVARAFPSFFSPQSVQISQKKIPSFDGVLDGEEYSIEDRKCQLLTKHEDLCYCLESQDEFVVQAIIQKELACGRLAGQSVYNVCRERMSLITVYCNAS